jgi:spore germination cell wall hydrolase CwlJ-like protein
VVAAEARGESIEGQMAVAQVIMDRATTRNQSIIRVCTAKNQFAEPYGGEISEKTKDAVSFVFDKGEKVFEQATHFYAWEEIAPPYWTAEKDYVGEIGGHRFYADR